MLELSDNRIQTIDLINIVSDHLVLIKVGLKSWRGCLDWSRGRDRWRDRDLPADSDDLVLVVLLDLLHVLVVLLPLLRPQRLELVLV